LSIEVTAAKRAKEIGLEKLTLAISLGWPRSTLNDMFNENPDKFEIVILGCIEKLKKSKV